MRKTIPMLVVALAFAACKKEQASTSPDAADDDFNQGAPEGGADASSDSDEADAPPVLTQSSFEDGVNAHMQDVADCYAEAQSKNAKLQGTMQARFTIAPDGKVTTVEAAPGSTLADAGMTACIQEKAQAWQFDPTPSGEPMPLEFPFTLAPD